MLLGGIAAHPNRWQACIVLSVLNLLEVALAAFSLRRRSSELPHFTDPRYILRFAAIAALAGPGATSILFAIIYSQWMMLHRGTQCLPGSRPTGLEIAWSFQRVSHYFIPG